MAKEFCYKIGKNILEKVEKPLRGRQEIVLLLLNTIKSFEANDHLEENGRTYIYINKMNRIFYVIDNKIFSLQFPFSVEECENRMHIYDRNTNITINSMVLSVLVNFFEKFDDMSFDELFSMIMDRDRLPENVTEEDIWKLICNLATFDFGYLRFDHDEKNFKPKTPLLHPIDHLDIGYDDAAVFKVGLRKPMNYENFKNMLDTTSDCVFLTF